ncbi:hypothetical protein BUALT_Bualt08G0041100 [Buddleja alternifolia]|uniref:Uncharacterized protein n=1 Tax=Buddleja alternifolia TaxID=168488 RepID=A0AAV6X2X9_9LAMI|nr:hypothetical protein BUALT_Bualt08G0041100 [Buddleja alternifolia]
MELVSIHSCLLLCFLYFFQISFPEFSFCSCFLELVIGKSFVLVGMQIGLDENMDLDLLMKFSRF